MQLKSELERVIPHDVAISTSLTSVATVIAIQKAFVVVLPFFLTQKPPHSTAVTQTYPVYALKNLSLVPSDFAAVSTDMRMGSMAC